MKTDTKILTGLTLMENALEFESLIPNKSDWVFEKHKDDPPVFVRLQQLSVLLQIFTPETYSGNDIAAGMGSLLNGDFIRLRDPREYASLFNSMDNVITSSHNILEKRSEWKLTELTHTYQDLVKFKKIVTQMVNLNNGIMEISYPFYYSVVLTQEIADSLDRKYLDGFLSSVIDTGGRTLKKETLVKEFNYPKVDVYNLNLDRS